MVSDPSCLLEFGPDQISEMQIMQINAKKVIILIFKKRVSILKYMFLIIIDPDFV